MEKILVSACLAGDLVRYDARRVPLPDEWLHRLLLKDMVVKSCPEVDGGMAIPRSPAQIVGGTGDDVLAGRARVMDDQGVDVTGFFIRGAESALSAARKFRIQVALLKEKSPSCGSCEIYDGSFSGRRIPGQGVTAAMLAGHGIKVFPETEIHACKSFVKQNYPSLDN